MSSTLYLTKSRFKIGHECPTKLFYNDHKDYANDKLDDAFLRALAEGGFQVGELAKIQYEGGIEIKEKEHRKAAAETAELLKRDQVTLYEAALLFENLFVRVDILEKKGDQIKLIEVKAKSISSDESFIGKKGALSSKWEPYIADISFQTTVAQKAYPQFRFSSYLCLANKDNAATIDGLHQLFLLKKEKGRTSVEVQPGTTKKTIGEPLLVTVNVDEEVGLFTSAQFDGRSFSEYVNFLSELTQARKRAQPKIGRACGNCEFKVAPEHLNGQKSGFMSCWTEATGLTEQQLSEPLLFDVWNLHFLKKDKLIEEQRYFMNQISREDIEPEDDESIVMSSRQRQWMQIEKVQKGDRSIYFDTDHFLHRWRSEEKWKPPFHFIDFETMTSAIPFHRGLRPYETIAFQFSHHRISAEGQITHQTQFIHTEPGVFPNFDFVRELKKALSQDEGSVFRYAAHENTVLNHIRIQLMKSDEKDREELIQFIETLTVRKENNIVVHRGDRAMIDMLDCVKKYFYSPLMGGSNSIKKVLPAVLNQSRHLKSKYAQAIYGAPGHISSHNFAPRAWVELDELGQVKDPYKSLGPLFNDVDPKALDAIERLFGDDEIKEGGAASTAYARMQFTRMSTLEREALAQALLRYCELDTLAMVMIWEYWTEELVKTQQDAA